MKCDVCGLEYGMTHNCAGARPTVVLPIVAAEELPPPPAGFVPFHYLREALRIATWNAEAIQRIARDRNALGYGIAIWIVANLIGSLVTAKVFSINGVSTVDILTRLIFSLPISAVLSIAQIGSCFLIAKVLMGGEGRFIEILRPLVLGSVVFLLMAIPYAGVILAIIAWICVFAMVFQVVADIEAFSAYLLTIIVGVVFRELGIFLTRAIG